MVSLLTARLPFGEPREAVFRVMAQQGIEFLVSTNMEESTLFMKNLYHVPQDVSRPLVARENRSSQTAADLPAAKRLHVADDAQEGIENGGVAPIQGAPMVQEGEIEFNDNIREQENSLYDGTLHGNDDHVMDQVDNNDDFLNAEVLMLTHVQTGAPAVVKEERTKVTETPADPPAAKRLRVADDVQEETEDGGINPVQGAPMIQGDVDYNFDAGEFRFNDNIQEQEYFFDDAGLQNNDDQTLIPMEQDGTNGTLLNAQVLMLADAQTGAPAVVKEERAEATETPAVAEDSARFEPVDIFDGIKTEPIVLSENPVVLAEIDMTEDQERMMNDSIHADPEQIPIELRRPDSIPKRNFMTRPPTPKRARVMHAAQLGAEDGGNKDQTPPPTGVPAPENELAHPAEGVKMEEPDEEVGEERIEDDADEMNDRASGDCAKTKNKEVNRKTRQSSAVGASILDGIPLRKIKYELLDRPLLDPNDVEVDLSDDEDGESDSQAVATPKRKKRVAPKKDSKKEKKTTKNGSIGIKGRTPSTTDKKTSKNCHQCDVCNKFCACSADLTIHKRIHTGEKPFSCDVCQRKFSQAGTLRRHSRVMHG